MTYDFRAALETRIKVADSKAEQARKRHEVETQAAKQVWELLDASLPREIVIDPGGQSKPTKCSVSIGLSTTRVAVILKEVSWTYTLIAGHDQARFRILVIKEISGAAQVRVGPGTGDGGRGSYVRGDTAVSAVCQDIMFNTNLEWARRWLEEDK